MLLVWNMIIFFHLSLWLTRPWETQVCFWWDQSNFVRYLQKDFFHFMMWELQSRVINEDLWHVHVMFCYGTSTYSTLYRLYFVIACAKAFDNLLLFCSFLQNWFGVSYHYVGRFVSFFHLTCFLKRSKSFPDAHWQLFFKSKKFFLIITNRPKGPLCSSEFLQSFHW